MLTDSDYEVIFSFDWTDVNLRDLINDVKRSNSESDEISASMMTEKEKRLTQIFKNITSDDIDNIITLVDQKNINDSKNIDIFIAHADLDSKIANALEAELKVIFDNKIKIFNSSNPDGIQGGFDWFNHIVKIHRNSKLGLVLITENALSNNWIHFEAGGFFLRKDPAVIPCFFSVEVLQNLPFPIKGIQGKKLWDAKFRESLVTQISKITGLHSNYDDGRFCKNVMAGFANVEKNAVDYYKLISNAINKGLLFGDKKIYTTSNILAILLENFPLQTRSLNVSTVYNILLEITNNGEIKKVKIDGAEIGTTPWRRIVS